MAGANKIAACFVLMAVFTWCGAVPINSECDCDKLNSEEVDEACINECKDKEKGDVYGGDDPLTDIDVHENNGNSRRKRRSVYGWSWPMDSDGNFYIAYQFDSDYPEEYREKVRAIHRQYDEKTCIRFIPRTNEASYINVIAGRGCYSYIGRQAIQPQEVSLPDGCLSNGTIAHEFMHALGFSHEHSRWDRDQHIKIWWQNIQERYKSQFDHPPKDQSVVVGMQFDVDSVMMYGRTAFSSGSAYTITKKGDENYPLGQRVGFSPIDLEQINRRYMCTKHVVPVRNIPDKQEEWKSGQAWEKEADPKDEGNFGHWGKK